MTTERPSGIIVLLSGRGSNYHALQQACRAGRVPGEIAAVLSDRPDAAGLDLARDDQIDAMCINRRQYPDRESFEQALATAIAAARARWIVLAGFMRVLSGAFVAAHQGRMINIHPSLLPRHRGLHTHQRVLDAGEPEHGASVHFVTPELDGGPVISCVRMPVRPDDTPERLAERLLPLEHRLLPATMALLLTQPVELRNETLFLQQQKCAQPLELGRDLSDDGRLLGQRWIA
ncbi:MAG: phosphoribosylglycinamide formyltransferase [Wenzhouxiangella sp.]